MGSGNRTIRFPGNSSVPREHSDVALHDRTPTPACRLVFMRLLKLDGFWLLPPQDFSHRETPYTSRQQFIWTHDGYVRLRKRLDYEHARLSCFNSRLAAKFIES